MRINPELKKRIPTALMGVTVLLLLMTAAGTFGAVIVSAVLSMAMLYEFVDITFSLSDKKEKRLALLGSSWLLSFLTFWIMGGEFGLLIAFFLGFVIFYLFTAERHQGSDLQTHYKELMYSVFGFIYLGYLPTNLITLRASAYGANWSALFFLLVWAGDTGAYFVGHRFGKNKLYAHISPGKTREGVYGGIALAVVVSILFKVIFFSALSWVGAFITPVIIGIIAPVGDLAESFLKRAFDKKDSGSLLPGHGGFLDRFDAVVLSLPVMVALTKIFSPI